MAKRNDKMVANNKKAYHDYFILDKIETGIALHLSLIHIYIAAVTVYYRNEDGG